MGARSFVSVALVATALAAGAAPATARNAPAGLTLTHATEHFLVHFGGMTPVEDAQATGAAGEAAYALFVGTWGFPAPVDDGDGRTDVYLAPGLVSGGETRADSFGLRSSSWIQLDATLARDNPFLLAHEYFHAIQQGIYQWSADWVSEGSAEWGGGAVASPEQANRANPTGSLDCRPDECDNAHARGRGGFFAYLAERFGPAFLVDVLQRAYDRAASSRVARPYDIESLEDALGARGTSLSALYRDFAVAAALDTYVPATLTTGPAGGALPEQAVTLPHLAAAYVAIRSPHDTADRTRACAAGTLSIAVQTPPGAAAHPAVVLADGTTAALTATGDTLGATLPWSSCGKRAVVVLPNPQVTGDGLTFAVRGSAAMDPVPVPVVRSLVPRRLRVRAGAVKLRVRASTAGRLAVTLASAPVRRTFTLLRGANTLTLRVPRRVRAGRHTLTLVPISQAGSRGARIVRRVTLVR